MKELFQIKHQQYNFRRDMRLWDGNGYVFALYSTEKNASLGVQIWNIESNNLKKNLIFFVNLKYLII